MHATDEPSAAFTLCKPAHKLLTAHGATAFRLRQAENENYLHFLHQFGLLWLLGFSILHIFHHRRLSQPLFVFVGGGEDFLCFCLSVSRAFGRTLNQEIFFGA